MSNATAADGGVRLMFAFKVKINEKIHAEIVEQLEAKMAYSCTTRSMGDLSSKPS